MSLHRSTAYSGHGPCFFQPVLFVSSKCLPRISLSFACDSSNADGGNEVNTKYHAWNSSELVSISTPAIVCGIGNEFPYVLVSWYIPDNSVPLAIPSSSHPSLLLSRSRSDQSLNVLVSRPSESEVLVIVSLMPGTYSVVLRILKLAQSV
jgi:hypothetical protein